MELPQRVGQRPCVQVLTLVDGALVAPGAANAYVMPAAEPEAEDGTGGLPQQRLLNRAIS